MLPGFLTRREKSQSPLITNIQYAPEVSDTEASIHDNTDAAETIIPLLQFGSDFGFESHLRFFDFPAPTSLFIRTGLESLL